MIYEGSATPPTDVLFLKLFSGASANASSGAAAGRWSRFPI